MKRRQTLIWLLVLAACILGAIAYLQLTRRTKIGVQAVAGPATVRSGPVHVRQPAVASQSSSTAPLPELGLPRTNATPTTAATLREAWLRHRLSNTTATIGELSRQDHAILLENALVDTRLLTDLAIPQNLRSQGDPGTYIVQSRTVLDDHFRAALKAAGAEIISYIPNNAYLVRATAAEATQLGFQPLTQAVLAYEPYYKLSPALLAAVMENTEVPGGGQLNVVLFPDARDNTLTALKGLGANVLGETPSPFGPVLSVQVPPAQVVAIAGLPGVQHVEIASKRSLANDLSRARVGVAADSVTPLNYFGLSGSNVLVDMNDSGVSQANQDLAGRVTGFPLTDTSGHGTHVAGTIAGSGIESITVTNSIGSINPAVPGQYRGMAPSAKLYVQDLSQSDFQLQQAAALTNALISNNSWNYGDQGYDIFAASYDAAVRDALPTTTGSQPVLFVFSAGNSGNGNDQGLTGAPDSIQSPATAKNVITVGALEQPRNVTNSVVIDGITNEPWAAMTDSSDQVASFSSRGNVGIGTEGDFGRFKPDVVAPGVFVVSDRSQEWDTNAYYHPTNYFTSFFTDVIQSNVVNDYALFAPDTCVGIFISSFGVFPTNYAMPIYVNPTAPPVIGDVPAGFGSVNITGAGLTPLGQIWFYGVGTPTNIFVQYDVFTSIAYTNDVGNYYAVLQGMNDSIGTPNPVSGQGWYRYESGTSMAAADVSGVLALIQDFFTNTLQILPSPALMKAMLINGARSEPLYDLNVRSDINYQGWGQVNLPTSLPSSIPTNSTSAARGALANGPSPLLLFDQNPSNAVATGSSQTIVVTLSTNAQLVPLRITLVWTDPPGNPAASIKLVNDLDLIVTNLDNTNMVYFGNDIEGGNNFTLPWNTNNPPNIDSVNNVENVYIRPPLGTNMSITVYGHRVNVNAVTAQTNNVSQDYALVVSSGSGEDPNALKVASIPPPSSTTSDVSFVTYTTNMFSGIPGISGSLLLNQHVGASFQLAGTNTIALGTNTIWGTNGDITLGQTNQWHFYVLVNTNNVLFTNAAFATFIPLNLSPTRMGVTNVDMPTNDVRLEADIDLYMSTDPGLTNLDPTVVDNAYKSLNRGGTELIVISNALPGQAYYVGVKSEDQQAAEYAFLGVFSQFSFSTTQNGVESLRGFPAPSVIPDGSASHPGAAHMLAIGVQPMTIQRAVVTNTITHQNFGDLLGSLTHNHKFDVLNNHSFGNGNLTQLRVYDDSDQHDIAISQPSDGPGSLMNFLGEQGAGVWMFTESDSALGSTGQVDNLFIRLDPQLGTGATNVVTLQPGSYTYFAIDIPPQATNLTVNLVNISTPPLQVDILLKLGSLPVLGNSDFEKDVFGNAGSLIVTSSDLPPLQPGRYYLGLYNPGFLPQTVEVSWLIFLNPNRITTVNYTSTGPVPIADDAVSYSTITVPNLPPNVQIAEALIGVTIDHPRVSDLVLTLISPKGDRLNLFENRGANASNLGTDVQVTNFFGSQVAGGAIATTNVIGPVPASGGTLYIDYDFFTLPDSMDVYYDGVHIFSTFGFVGGSGTFTIPYGPGTGTTITIVMNQNGNPQPTTAWIYTPRVVSQLVSYFTFTDDTNFTQIPVKFAIPPYNNLASASRLSLGNFDPPVAPGDYPTGTVVNGWTVLSNQVSVVNDPPSASSPPQFLALATGVISNNLPVIPGERYNFTYAYRGPGIVSWWRGETNANDYVGTNNGSFVGSVGLAPGLVGNAFNFTAANAHIFVPASPSLDVGTGAGFTVEMWVNPTSVANRQALAEWNSTNNPTGIGTHFFIAETPAAVSNPGDLYANLVDTGGGSHIVQTSPGVMTAGTFQHVALTYNKATGVVVIYRNGVAVLTQNVGSFTPQTSFDFYLGYRASGTGTGATFGGLMDEPSVYSRSLSASEIIAIYNRGAQGKFNADPSVPIPQDLAEAQVSLLGVRTDTLFGNNTNWQVWNSPFSVQTSSIPVLVTGIEPGMLLDSFVLAQVPDDYFVQPEEPLHPLVGENPSGTWTLEVRDTRVGPAGGSTPQIASWQLQFVLATNVTGSGTLTGGNPVTNTLAPCSTNIYIVDVPYWATFATNTILFSSGGLNIWFNQNTPPTGNPLAGDFQILSSAGPVTVPLSTTLSLAGVPPLIPGARYYLAVDNPCSATTSNTYAIQVDFGLNLITLTNMVPFTNSNAGQSFGNDYYAFNIPPNAARAQFEIDNPTADMALLVRQGLPLPSPFQFDYLSDNPGTNDELIVVLTNSVPVPLSAGNWYLTAVNVSNTPATSYTIIASWWTETGRPYNITGTSYTTNDFCLTWDTLPGVHYFVEGRTSLTNTSWTTISGTLTATGNSYTYCVPLPSPYHYFRVVEGLVLTGAGPTVTASITPLGVLLQWTGPANAQYEVDWTSQLAPPNWTPFPVTITSFNGQFSFLDDGSLTGGLGVTRYYRVVQLP